MLRPKRVSGARQPAVFLDRDGVINRSEVRDGKAYAPRALSDFRLLPGVIQAVRDLKAAGYVIVVATNQPDIGNGKVDVAVVESMHAVLRRKLPVDEIAMCPHRQTENCACRKPKPGMLTEAARRLDLDLQKSYMVGDRWSDIVAGRSAGCYTVFVNRGYRELLETAPDATVSSLPAAARLILSRHPMAITGVPDR